MKELSIEEKAARYDKAIEKLRSLHDNYDTINTLIDIKKELEHIFPELKENKDELMRRKLLALIEWAKSYAASGISSNEAKEMTTWVEKQELLDNVCDLIVSGKVYWILKGDKEALAELIRKEFSGISYKN